MSEHNIRPTTNKVLVRPERSERVTAGGIVIPDNAADRADLHQAFGYLVEAGPDAWSEFSEPGAAVGDRVIYARYGGIKVVGADNRVYQIMNDIDITSVIGEGVRKFETGELYD